MSLQWYARYPGDYMRDTSHLTLIQHGAYTRLLDHYYSTGRPLPPDNDSLHRLTAAMTAEERVAVDSVVNEFFPVNGDGMRHNKRADVEIRRRLDQHEALSVAGSRGVARREAKRHGAPMPGIMPGMTPGLCKTTSTTTPTPIATPTPTTEVQEVPPTPPSGGNGQPHADSPPAKPKRQKPHANARVSANTPLMVRLGRLFGRKETTLWSIAEKQSLDALAPAEDEVAVIEGFYREHIPHDQDYRRRDLKTLLNNWSGELDKANRYENNKPKVQQI